MSTAALKKDAPAFLGIKGKSSVASPGKNGKSSSTPVADEARTEFAQRGKINRYKMQRHAQKLLPEYRNLSSCGRNVRYRADNPGVDIYIDKSSNKAHYANIVTCKSVWACPICAHRITEERRADLQSAVVVHSMKDGKVLLMTLTFPHERDSSLKELLEKQADALRRFNAVTRYRKLLNSIGFLGSVRALEVTHGENGWHPHIHVLLFIGKNEDATQVVAQARDFWAKAVFKAGLGHINEHGFDVRGGDYAAEYVAKFGKEPDSRGWTAAHELTKTPIKMGRKKESRTPFQLLEDSMKGDEQAGALFREYVEAFKGKRQLYWSPGLRDKLGMAEEKSDEEILAEGEELEQQTELVGTLTGEDWRLVLSRDARGEVLVLAERHGWPGVRQFLEILKKSAPKDEAGFGWEAITVGFGGKPMERLLLPG